ncbi:G-protein beta WD-40 repeat protein [Rhodopirellula islandica]|uniref:G-protein beta WD-40 repeat protein n=1 Tax=Rhodopirellula islandica TaxID=595434 RepID=A0A0J1BHD5_RHOIS|nr:WD40 repeat domain-containing protein [Rhodopirellula islandica]KLU05952.1 G-protein beta WD-40 repeat protein [Rhodopirellula islandica]
MGTALFAIFLVFTQTEGCGTRYSTIETLSFSSDDSQILVTKLTARDARTPMKRYKSNLARTVSWVDTSTGAGRGTVHQDFKPGNSGPAFRHWWVGRTSVVCNPKDDRIAFSGFGGGDLTYGVAQTTPTTIPLAQPAANLTVSKSGRFVAASGAYHLTVVDTSTLKPAMQKQIGDSPFLGASWMSFNSNDTLLITVGDAGGQVWDLATGTQTAMLPIDSESLVRSIAVMPDDSVVICFDSSTKRYDLTGSLLNTINETGGYVCAASRISNMLAISDGETVRLCDVTDGTITRTLSTSGVMSVAVSSDDKYLATGDYDGNVVLFDLLAGNRQWASTPPGRHRWPWTIPATILGIWCWIAYRLSNCWGDPSS